MNDPYISYRLKWACFFVGIFMPAVVFAFFLAADIETMSSFALVMTLIVTIITVPVVGSFGLLIWQIIKQPRLYKPPGTTLLAVVEFLYPDKAVKAVFEPLVADWRVEYYDAWKENRTIKARWISVRYTYSFIIAMGLSKFLSFVRRIAGR